MLAQLKHFTQRLFTVERKIGSPRKQWAFLFRWLRYAVHHYHLLPKWAKIAKIILIIAIIFSPQIRNEWQSHRYKQQVYQTLYTQFYNHHKQLSPGDGKAEKYADYYAEHYSKYYASDAYRNALRSALPTKEDMPLLMEQVAREALPNIRPLSIAPIGLELLKHLEGLRLKPYKDAGGKYTIGYGHLMRKGESFTTITKTQAMQLLIEDVRIAEAVVKKYVRMPINRHQFSALVSLVYNIGGYQFRKSTLLKKLNQGDYTSAANEFSRWNKVGKKTNAGLRKRRTMEKKLFTGEWRNNEG